MPSPSAAREAPSPVRAPSHSPSAARAPSPAKESVHVDFAGEAPPIQGMLIRYDLVRKDAAEARRQNRRMPKRYESDYKTLEQAIAKEIRSLNPLLFQHFSSSQLERLVAAMPLLRPHKGRFLIGSTAVEPVWPASKGRRTFLLLGGRMSTFRSRQGQGGRTEVSVGTLIGEQPLKIGEDQIPVQVVGSALCVDSCIVGVLSQSVFEKAFQDRAMGNERITQTTVNRVHTFGSVALSEQEMLGRDAGNAGAPERDALARAAPAKAGAPAGPPSGAPAGAADGAPSGAPAGASAGAAAGGGAPSGAQGAASASAQPRQLRPHAGRGGKLVEVMEGLTGKRLAEENLRAIAKHTIEVHLRPGEELLHGSDSAEDFLLVVVQGNISVRADMRLRERLECKSPRKARLRLFIDKAEELAGDSILDKLDPYCVVKLGEAKQFQTPVVMNAGKCVNWGYSGAFVYDNEENVDFMVMDRDFYSADDLCGSASVPVSHFGRTGWSGKVALTRPKRNFLFVDPDPDAAEPAGSLHFTAEWDFERPDPRAQGEERCFPDEELFLLRERETWGQECLTMGASFRSVLCKVSDDMRYALELGPFRIVGVESAGGGTNQVITCWKIVRQRLTDLLRATRRENHFTVESKASALAKKATVSRHMERLAERWADEERRTKGWASQLGRPCAGASRGALTETPLQKPPEAAAARPDTEQFRVQYCGKHASVAIRSAANLPAGGWFSKLQPFAVIRFAGSRTVFSTSVVENVGTDPVWSCEGTLLYNGETILEVNVYDYNARGDDELIATGSLPVADFYRGYEGDVCVAPPSGSKRRKGRRQMTVNISILWEAVLNARGSVVSAARKCSLAEMAP